MHYRKTVLVVAMSTMAIMAGGFAHAGISADEARQLGSSLTLVGAEKGANRDGSIPAYTGGLTQAPAGFKPGNGLRTDPFADDKPLYAIDSRNAGTYEGALTEGTKALLKKYPDFRVDVFKTQRTVAYPKFVEANTQKCAQTAKTINDGRTLKGCHAGIPFPIPKTGFEVMWNHLVRYNGGPYKLSYRVWFVNAAGQAALTAAGITLLDYPYWDKDKVESGVYVRQRNAYTGPARKAGEGILLIDPLDFVNEDRRAWSYLPGQRRVRVAPDLAHDTPSPNTGGISTMDDSFMFSGSMDRFDFKLVGKKEVILPYNTYKLSFHTSSEQMLKPHFINPDTLRWERHRAWVVEANLREGKRHIYSKRRFYIDEDSWAILASEAYDARGQLFRVGFNLLVPLYDLPAPNVSAEVHYDLVAGGYAIVGHTAETGGLKSEALAEREWAPDTLAGGGVR